MKNNKFDLVSVKITRKKAFLKGKIQNIFQFILDIINIKIIAFN